MSTPAPGPDFNVVLIGAGGIVFGNDNVRWNHSIRLEARLGPRLRILAIIDPSPARVSWALSQKHSTPSAPSYAFTQRFDTISAAAAALAPTPIHLVILAAPPNFRGSLSPGRDLEAQILVAWPATAPVVFAEKPVSAGAVGDAWAVAGRLAEEGSGRRWGVGYMMRYLRVVQKAVGILRERGLRVMCVNARYVCAYQRIRKREWWDKELLCGPIVEQATHFCDLCRYLGGEVVMESVQATSVEHYEEAGKLEHQHEAIREWEVPEENRIPRVTTAFWKYENGAVGTLTHMIALHGISYANEIDIVADGYQLRLVDLYIKPRLFVRFPTDEREEEFHYPGDDPFTNEINAMVNEADSVDSNTTAAMTNGAEHHDNDDAKELTPDKMLSSYEDAVKTYEFSWRIREKSEESRVPHPSWTG